MADIQEHKGDNNNNNNNINNNNNVLSLSSQISKRIAQSTDYILAFRFSDDFPLPQIQSVADHNVEYITSVSLDGVVIRMLEMYSKTNFQKEAIEQCYESIRVDLHKIIMQILVGFTHIALLHGDNDNDNELQDEENDKEEQEDGNGSDNIPPESVENNNNNNNNTNRKKKTKKDKKKKKTKKSKKTIGIIIHCPKFWAKTEEQRHTMWNDIKQAICVTTIPKEIDLKDQVLGLISQCRRSMRESYSNMYIMSKRLLDEQFDTDANNWHENAKPWDRYSYRGVYRMRVVGFIDKSIKKHTKTSMYWNSTSKEIFKPKVKRLLFFTMMEYVDAKKQEIFDKVGLII